MNCVHNLYSVDLWTFDTLRIWIKTLNPDIRYLRLLSILIFFFNGILSIWLALFSLTEFSLWFTLFSLTKFFLGLNVYIYIYICTETYREKSIFEIIFNFYSYCLLYKTKYYLYLILVLWIISWILNFPHLSFRRYSHSSFLWKNRLSFSASLFFSLRITNLNKFWIFTGYISICVLNLDFYLITLFTPSNSLYLNYLPYP